MRRSIIFLKIKDNRSLFQVLITYTFVNTGPKIIKLQSTRGFRLGFLDLVDSVFTTLQGSNPLLARINLAIFLDRTSQSTLFNATHVVLES